MSIADRSYLREEYHPPRVCTYLIVALLVAFFIQCLAMVYGEWDVLGSLALKWSGIKSGRIWQLLTFQFLHSAPWPWHVLMNCLGLYFFGRSVEETLGSKKFIQLYFTSGVIGGLLYLLATVILPKHLDIPVVGASAGVCGMIAIFCSLYPMRELTVFIYFFPVTVRAHYFLWFLLLLSIFGTIIPFDGVAHAAHLGGLLTGIGFVRWIHESDRLAEFLGRFRFRRRPVGRAVLRREAAFRERPARAESGPTEFISKEVDPILDKIAAHGIHSLTAEEKKVLESARARMEKR